LRFPQPILHTSSRVLPVIFITVRCLERHRQSAFHRLREFRRRLPGIVGSGTRAGDRELFRFQLAFVLLAAFPCCFADIFLKRFRYESDSQMPMAGFCRKGRTPKLVTDSTVIFSGGRGENYACALDFCFPRLMSVSDNCPGGERRDRYYDRSPRPRSGGHQKNSNLGCVQIGSEAIFPHCDRSQASRAAALLSRDGSYHPTIQRTAFIL